MKNEDYAQGYIKDNDPTQRTFLSLKPHILDILISTLAVETSVMNCKMILQLLNHFVIEDIRFCNSMPSIVIGAIRDKVKK